MISEDEFLSRIQAVPLQRLDWHLANRMGVDVFIRRDDLVDEHLSGNKFYKLYYNLKSAKENGFRKVLSYGGAYSNHIFALAAGAHINGFESVGVIRGERPKELSPTLKDAEAWGMKLHFISRADYKNVQSAEIQKSLSEAHGEFFEIPEGGANSLGLKGTVALGKALDHQVGGNVDAVCVACGTGNTLAGIASGFQKPKSWPERAASIVGFSVLKEPKISSTRTLGADVVNFYQLNGLSGSNWRIVSGFHGGGYGKSLPQNMRQFMDEFESQAGLRLDPVYTVKMCFGVARLLSQRYWPKGSRIVLVHTGGLQGRRGFRL